VTVAPCPAKSFEKQLILASASPRRRDLLARINVSPDDICPTDIDESVRQGELPKHYALRMALEKAAAVDVERRCGAWVLAGDTVVAVGRRVLPKAESADVARQCLSLLSGRRHHVLTSICVDCPDGRQLHRLNDNIVQFKRLTNHEIQSYIDEGEWQGKAGGYAIQGFAEAFVQRLSGSHSGVMGLPLLETRNLLLSSGYLSTRTS